MSLVQLSQTSFAAIWALVSLTSICTASVIPSRKLSQRFDLSKTGGMMYESAGDHSVTEYDISHTGSPQLFSINSEEGQVTVQKAGIYKVEFSLFTDFRQVFFKKTSPSEESLFAHVCVKVDNVCQISATKLSLSSSVSGTFLLRLTSGQVLSVVAEWNSLKPQFMNSRLYFGGELVEES